MDRRLLIPAVAVTAWAQQASPAAAQAEKAVRARAEKFYQLEVDKNFRGAWALVAEDTQDYFFNGGRPDFKSFVIDKIELSDNNTHARVSYRVTRVVPMPGMGTRVFEFPGTSTWKFENGDWFWYVDQSAGLKTPFGEVKNAQGTPEGGSLPAMPGVPNLAALKAQVSIDRTAVVLSDAAPVQTVAISNHMPGPVTVELRSPKIAGLTVELDHKQLGSQQKATLSFRAEAGARPSGIVGVDVAPLGQHFDVTITSK